MDQNNKSFSETLKSRIYKLILDIIQFVGTLDARDPVCKVVIDQLIRCSTSIGANYVEAIAGSSRKDFTNFLSHSLKSANETKFWLALLRDSEKGNKEKVNQFLIELQELTKILATSIKTLRGK